MGDGVDLHETTRDPLAGTLGISNHKNGASKVFVARSSSGRLKYARTFGHVLRGLSKLKANHHINKRANQKRNKMMWELEEGSALIEFRKNWKKVENVSYCIDMTNVVSNLYCR